MLELLPEGSNCYFCSQGKGMVGHFGCPVSLLLHLLRQDDGIVL